MSPSAVPYAVQQGKQSDMEIVAMNQDAKCFPQYAPSAAKTLKYLLSLAMVDQFIVVSATVRLD
jgi:hypothetical protein